MSEFTARLRDEMVRRIDELVPLVDELARLRAAVDLLDGISPEPPAPPPVDPGAIRGTRQLLIARLVAEHPGITVQQVADRMQVGAPTLYPPVRRLVAGGHVVRRGRQLFLPDALED